MYIYACIYIICIYIYAYIYMISYIPKKCRKPRFAQAREAMASRKVWNRKNNPHLDPLNKASQCGTKLHTTHLSPVLSAKRSHLLTNKA